MLIILVALRSEGTVTFSWVCVCVCVCVWGGCPTCSRLYYHLFRCVLLASRSEVILCGWEPGLLVGKSAGLTLKGCEFESPQERRDNFLLQS